MRKSLKRLRCYCAQDREKGIYKLGHGWGERDEKYESALNGSSHIWGWGAFCLFFPKRIRFEDNRKMLLIIKCLTMTFPPSRLDKQNQGLSMRQEANISWPDALRKKAPLRHKRWASTKKEPLKEGHTYALAAHYITLSRRFAFMDFNSLHMTRAPMFCFVTNDLELRSTFSPRLFSFQRSFFERWIKNV